jgi:hypothetical protein
MEDLDDRDYPPRSTENTQDQTTPTNRRHQDQPRNQYNDDIDNVMSWSERFQFHVQRTKHWYDSQTDDIKAVLKVLLGLVVLYVAFGGRFGLEYLSSPSSSSTERRNVYEEFYQERRQRHQNQEQGSRNRQYYDPYGGGYNYASDDQAYSRHRRGSSWGFGGYGGSSSFPASLLFLAAVAYVAHRNGINPFQALFFANMAMGGRGRGGLRRGIYPGGWGPGGMMGGFGHRGGRPRW